MSASDPTLALLPPPQSLLPARPEQGRSLVLVLIIMAFLASLALLFSRGADRLSERWSAQLSQTSTVQIMLSSEYQREPEMMRAIEVLRETLPEASIQSLSRAQSGALIRPWLGGTALPDDLPVPGVIQVEAQAKLPQEVLTRKFEEAGLVSVIDDHSRFSADLKRTVGRLVLLGVGLVTFVGVAATAVSIFATRASLASQRDIIHVLVQAGATDRFIAGLMVGQAAKRGLIGGLCGSGLALVLWLILSFGPASGTVGWRSLAQGGLIDSGIDLLALGLLSLAFCAVCALSAGWAALRQLAFERRRA
ncbi:MAG: hypothetical protein AAFP97_01920 [Pseudomonadota bacterium]